MGESGREERIKVKIVRGCVNVICGLWQGGGGDISVIRLLIIKKRGGERVGNREKEGQGETEYASHFIFHNFLRLRK